MTTSIPSILGAATMPLKAAGQRAGADKGDPQVSAAEISNKDGIKVGVWECSPGGWPIENRADTEVATILSGRATITDADGTTRELVAGSVIDLPKGWTGRWDVTETVRKIYVIVS
ncbi:MAG: cupin domain-containing protein [Alphaproteobacteria bacterium]|jgi:uncharacterized cupin superfamily protein